MSIRLTPALRTCLEEERKKFDPERTLSHEIETRLWQSLELEVQIENRFHGRRNYFVAQLIADGIGIWIQALTGQRVWEDPYAFEEAKIFINALLSYLRPKGRRVPPQHSQAFDVFYSRGAIGRWVARLSIAACEHSARHPGQGTAGPVFRLIDQAALNIVAQLVKSGKSALAEFSPEFYEDTERERQKR